LEKLVPQLQEEKTELFRALIQQLGNLGNQQIRNVAVRRTHSLSVSGSFFRRINGFITSFSSMGC